MQAKTATHLPEEITVDFDNRITRIQAEAALRAVRAEAARDRSLLELVDYRNQRHLGTVLSADGLVNEADPANIELGSYLVEVHNRNVDDTTLWTVVHHGKVAQNWVETLDEGLVLWAAIRAGVNVNDTNAVVAHTLGGFRAIAR